MLSVSFDLVLTKFGYKGILPALPVLRTKDDFFAGLGLVEHLLQDVATGLPLPNPRDLVISESFPQRLVYVDLRSISQFVSSLLLELLVHQLHLLLKGLSFSVEIGLLFQKGDCLVLLKSLTLKREFFHPFCISIFSDLLAQTSLTLLDLFDFVGQLIALRVSVLDLLLRFLLCLLLCVQFCFREFLLRLLSGFDFTGLSLLELACS